MYLYPYCDRKIEVKWELIMLFYIWIVLGFISTIMFFVDDIKRKEDLFVSNIVFYIFLLVGGALSSVLTYMSFFGTFCISDFFDKRIWTRKNNEK